MAGGGSLGLRLLEFIQAEFPKQPSAPVMQGHRQGKTDSWEVAASVPGVNSLVPREVSGSKQRVCEQGKEMGFLKNSRWVCEETWPRARKKTAASCEP